MPVTVPELQEFQDHPNFAHFVHTNLHVHTPCTTWDWDNYPNQTTKAAKLTPESYFEALNRTTLELVAITDHNCVSWCEPLIRLAITRRNEGRSKLHILPGVEITTYEGPHLLAIFDENKEIEDIKNMLIRLGMSARGDEGDRVGMHSPNDEITISHVLEEVTDHLGGIILAPHAHQNNGIWGNKDFRGRSAILNDRRLAILAVPSGDIKRVIEDTGQIRLLYKNMDSTQISNSFGFINVSDCHRLEDFEVNTTWIRMTTPSLNGVRQIIYEPELRLAHQVMNTNEPVQYPEAIEFTQPVQAFHPYIIGMAVTGGMLDGQRVTLSPHQNCIIGKNYSGKSALLDCLRFVLNVLPSDSDTRSKIADRLLAFVGDGGEVRAYVRDENARLFGITRTFACTRIGRGTPPKLEIEGEPEVFSLWNNQFRHESDLSVEQIFHLEMYPQGEVVQIKDNAAQQMSIVDSLAGVASTIKDLTSEDTDGDHTLLGKLIDNSRSIILRSERQNELATEIAGITQLQEEIASLETLSNSPEFEQKKQWSQAEVTIDRYQGEVQRLSNYWSQDDLLVNPGQFQISDSDQAPLQTSSRTSKFRPASASASDFASRAENIFHSAINSVTQAATKTREDLVQALGDLESLASARKSREEAVDESIRQQLSADAPAMVEGGLIDRITQKRLRLNDLVQKQSEHATIGGQIQDLRTTRVKLLEEFRSKWSVVHNARTAVVSTLDSQSASNIRAELLDGADRRQYRHLMDEVSDRLTSAANRIKNKDTQLDAIATSTTPEQLIEIAATGDANQLIRVAPDVTMNTASIILSMGEAEKHRLEECLLDDKFVISYKRPGDSDFTPIDSALSGGEQALALISVAMVPKRLPLVIDQPEDELGPALITHELVEQIRVVKATRQLIFVTHVPNIPVLGDSDQILYMEQHFPASGRALRVMCSGSLDRMDIVTHLLELDGGDAAFKKRRVRYDAVTRDTP